jgi:ABC-type Na+ efflux pump permease subunit
MAITILIGFWPTYFGPLISGSLAKQPIIHFHGGVFMGWIALFTTQAVLASTGRIALHRKVGKVGIAYGVLIVVVGLATTFNQLANGIAAGEAEAAQSGLIAPFTDMIVFPIFFGMAVAYRRKPEIHKRWMLLATVMLLVAAVLRMGLGGRHIFLIVWLAPVLVAMAYDYASRKIVHPVYVIGLVVLTLVSLRDLARETDVWMGIARGLSKLVA